MRLIILGMLATLLAFQAHAQLKNESEAGVSIVSGNANTENYTLKQLSTYGIDESNAVKGQGRYVQGRTSGVESSRAWDVMLRYERILSPLWTVFAAHTVESDVFGGFVQRDSSDLGAKYFLIKNDDQELFSELGYRYQSTQYVVQRANVDVGHSSARAYGEYNQKISATASAKIWVEYIPSFKNSDEYLINGEPSVTAMLSDVFSLKTSYLVKYQNPSKATAGLKSFTDTTFLTTLVAKF